MTIKISVKLVIKHQRSLKIIIWVVASCLDKVFLLNFSLGGTKLTAI